MVIGAGVIGLSAARALRRAGWRVGVVDAGRPGRGAAWAAGGMLAPAAEALEADPSEREDRASADLAWRSAALWPDFAAALEADSGRSLGFHAGETLILARTEAAAARLAAASQDLPATAVARLLTGDAARRRAPQVSPDVTAAVHAPNDGRVDPRAVMAALLAAAERAGIALHADAPVAAIRPGRPVRVRYAEGAASGPTRADVVVLAAGWRGAGVAVDGWDPTGLVRPVKGQMVALDLGADAPASTLRAPGVYIVPRGAGRVVVGATVEPGAHDTQARPADVDGLIARAAALAPCCADATVLDAWAGVRPAPAHGRALIGPVGPGVLAALGHYRNGVLLAPATAALIADLAAGRTPPDAAAFAPPTSRLTAT